MLAVVAVRDPLVGALGALVLLLTQIEYPDLYGDLLDLEAPVLLLVAVRNILLATFFVTTLWQLRAQRDSS